MRPYSYFDVPFNLEKRIKNKGNQPYCPPVLGGRAEGGGGSNKRVSFFLASRLSGHGMPCPYILNTNLNFQPPPPAGTPPKTGGE